MKDYYKILGLPEQSTEEEIKSAYRKLAKQYHPDVVRGDQEKEARMYEIQEAYHCLGDKEKRREYDEARLKKQSGNRAGDRNTKKDWDKDEPVPDMSQFEQFFGFQPGKGMESYHDKKSRNSRPEGAIKPEEMFASFFGNPGKKGGR